MTNIKKQISQFCLCNKSGVALSEEERQSFWNWIDKLCKSKKVCFVFRGDDKLRMQFNVDATDIDLLSHRLFMLGEKGFAFWKQCNDNTEFIKNDSEDALEYVWKKFNEKVCKLKFEKENTLQRVARFLNENPEFEIYFGNEQNREAFMSFSQGKNSTKIKDYYLSLLHTIGKSGNGCSYFLSSSKSFKTACEFSKEENGIVIVGWVPKKGKKEKMITYNDMENNNMDVSGLGLPTFHEPVYSDQHEICLKCGLLPHYIIGYITQNKFIVNPEALSEWNDNIPIQGMNIDQKDFAEILEATNYGRAFYFNEGNYGFYPWI